MIPGKKGLAKASKVRTVKNVSLWLHFLSPQSNETCPCDGCFGRLFLYPQFSSVQRSLVFPILSFSSTSLHWLVRKAFLSLLAILYPQNCFRRGNVPPLSLDQLTSSRRKCLVLQFSSVAQSCPTLCDPMNCNTPGLPVHHQLPEFTQTHVHQVSDAIQLSHPLSSPSPPAPNPSQHQSLFQWVNSSHEVAKVLEFQL